MFPKTSYSTKLRLWDFLRERRGSHFCKWKLSQCGQPETSGILSTWATLTNPLSRQTTLTTKGSGDGAQTLTKLSWLSRTFSNPWLSTMPFFGTLVTPRLSGVERFTCHG